MASKEKIRNKPFKTVKDKLEYIQKNSLEPELFDDLQQLFKNKGFNNVVINHGNREFGKDLVFSKYDDAFEEEVWYAAIVKNKPAKQNDFIKNGEIVNQINQSFAIPYKNPKGEEKKISGVFVVVNGNVTDNATVALQPFVDAVIIPHIKIWDYRILENQIEEFSKESFLDNLEPTLNLYIESQVKKLSDISVSNSVYALNIDDINDIFINVQTTYNREVRMMNNYVSFDNEKERLKTEDVEGSNEILKAETNFIIHGIPTSGKTLFLKRIGLKALNQTNKKLNAVFFFDLQLAHSSDFDINEMIKNQYKELTKGEEFNIDDFGKTILLFDSIDFIKNDSCKKKILEIIEKFGTEASQTQIIFAMRDLSFIQENNLLSSYKTTELLPFNFNQALQLVRKIIPNDENKSQNFIKALRSNLLDTSLQRTPLALTLIAILYRDDKVDLKELPANIFELYNKFTDVYLDKWDSSKGLNQLYKYEQTKNIIGLIALHLHNLGFNSIHENDLKILLIELSSTYPFDAIEDEKSIDEFILHLKTKKGVFYYDMRQQTFNFFNLHFQEFFVSLALEDEESEILIEKFFDGWWSNALVFYCGKNNKSFKIHKQLLDAIIPLNAYQKHVYINLHSKCLQASHSISNPNRSLIVSKLLYEYDQFFESLIQESTNPESFIHQVPFVAIINQSKRDFEQIFDSKHIATKDTLKLFESILLEDNQFSNITKYNIAYYLAHKTNSPVPFELFQELIAEDVVWNRILYVDINFLNLKKKIGDKVFVRIKRKMNTNKFLIQHILSSGLGERERLLPDRTSGDSQDT